MKKTSLFVLILLSGIVLKSFGQKIEENKTDDFTKKSVKRTSWETLVSNLSVNAHFRVSNIDNSEFFDVKIMLDKMFFVNKDQELMLKLDDGNVITLQNDRDVQTCKGCGSVGFRGSQAPGIELIYPVDKDQIEKLKTHTVTKIRINTGDGYFDEDVKDKNAEKIKASFNLL